MSNSFTDKELILLKEEYPKNKWNIPELLKQHPKESIIWKAKELGLAKSGFPRWTDREIIILKANYPLFSLEELTELLPGRTETAIKWRVAQLKLKKGTRVRWTKEEDRIVLENYGKIPVNDIVPLVNHKLPSLYQRIRQLRDMGLIHMTIKPQKKGARQIWTDEELAFLKENYSRLGAKELSKRFNYRHSENAIHKMVRRLGRPKKIFQNKWTDEEIRILKESYEGSFQHVPSELLKRHDYNSIRHKAKSLGMIKPVVRYDYTEEIDCIILKNYPSKSIREIREEFLPDLPEHAINSRIVHLRKIGKIPKDVTRFSYKKFQKNEE